MLTGCQAGIVQRNFANAAQFLPEGPVRLPSSRGAHAATQQHVWIVNHYASRPDEAAIRHFALARELLAHGWSGSIIGCSVQHYTGKQRLKGWRISSTEAIGGVAFRWLRMPTYRTNGIMRVVNMVGFAAFLLLPSATRDLQAPDVIVGSTVHPLAAWAASRLARRRRVPFVFEIRDLWPETLIELGAIRRNGVVARGLRRLELSMCNRADMIVTTMPFAYEYLNALGIAREKIRWISNGVASRDFEVTPGATVAVPPRPFTFMYFGALGRANRVEDLVDAFAATRFERDTRLRVIGSGPLRDAIVRKVGLACIGGRVSIEDRVPRGELPGLAAQSDCLVLGVLDTRLYDYGVSLNKLFEYMAAAKPIIFSGVVRGNPVMASGGGICCAPEVDAISRAMLEVARAEDSQLASWGGANRRYVQENFDFEALGLLLAEALDALI